LSFKATSFLKSAASLELDSSAKFSLYKYATSFHYSKTCRIPEKIQLEITVELREVTKIYGDVTAVDSVSLKIRSGEFFSLLGPSGCGKTTTLRLIAGFETPSSGEVLINQVNVIGKRPYERNVNTVFQNYALFPHLTVADNIAFGLARKKTPRQKIKPLVDEALGLVRLGGLGPRYPRQLSGGQQQRVALARALVLHPDVLLLDEPLGALDLKLRKEMQLELKSLQEKVGITFIYVTHDQEEALAMSDRLAVMSNGRLIQVGFPEEIYDRPKTHFVADFIGSSNFFSGCVIEKGSEAITVATDGGLEVILPIQDKINMGQRLQFAIRPEKLYMNSDQQDSPFLNRFSGKILNKTYLGSSVNYVISLNELEQVTASAMAESSTLSMKSFTPGEEVTVSWQKEDCVILSD